MPARARTQDRGRLEFLAEAFSDFRTFCGLLQIVPKSGVRQQLVLNEIQQAYCAQRTQRDVALKARQVGFTTLEQARDVFVFLTRPGSRVVTTCQSMQDETPARLLAANYRLMFKSLRALGVRLDFTTENAAEWVIASRDSSLRIIQAGASQEAASKKGRAGTITRLHLTETAFYEYAADTLNALFECVPGPEFGTEIINESTPNGASGVYYQQFIAAMSGANGYAAHFFPWFMQGEYRSPLAPGERLEPQTAREIELVERHRVSPEQLKWYREKVAVKGAELTDQEYPTDPETCFLVSGRTFFDVAVTRALLSQARPPLVTEAIGQASTKGTLQIWAAPVWSSDYVVAVDPSEGVGGDPGAAVVYERRTGQHVATLHGQFATWELARVSADVGRRYNTALLVVERNNHGHAVLQALEREEKYPDIYEGHDGKPGWTTSAVTRAAALDAFEDAHRTGQWTTNDRELLGEMLRFVVNRFGKPEAAAGAHDDLVLATAIAWDVLSSARGYATRTSAGTPKSTYRFGASRGF